MLSNEFSNEQLSFICYRVADMPTTPRVSSVRLPCTGCDAPIWVPVSAPSLLRKICTRCLHIRYSRLLAIMPLVDAPSLSAPASPLPQRQHQ
jgi:hypothetical protein